MAGSSGSGPGRIFMSYRREDTAYPAGWLYDRLADRFGRDQVFKDIDSIELGLDFVEVITTAVGSCDVLLALIGDRWLTLTDPDGRRRLDNPNDFVRLEIEVALTRNVRVIPILVEGTRMPHADELPESLGKLARRQALELSPARFDADIGKLLRVLDQALKDATASRAPTAEDVDPAPSPSGPVVPTAPPSGLRGSFELPKNGDEVGRRIQVRGHVTGSGHDHRLWIAHRREPQGAFWPKFPRVQPDDRGNFSISVLEGGLSGRITISLLAVPVSRSRDFEQWLHDGEATGHYPGIDPTSADDELASVTVSYTSDA